MLRNSIFETWILVASCFGAGKRFWLGIGLVMGVCLMLSLWESSRIFLQYNFITTRRVCALGEELLRAWPLHSFKMLSAEGILNIPALLGAEQLLLFLGRMRALQLIADGLSRLSPQLFFQGVASTVSTGGRIEDFLNCVFNGRVCLVMPWKGSGETI